MTNPKERSSFDLRPFSIAKEKVVGYDPREWVEIIAARCKELKIPITRTKAMVNALQGSHFNFLEIINGRQSDTATRNMLALADVLGLEVAFRLKPQLSPRETQRALRAALGKNAEGAPTEPEDEAAGDIHTILTPEDLAKVRKLLD